MCKKRTKRVKHLKYFAEFRDFASVWDRVAANRYGFIQRKVNVSAACFAFFANGYDTFLALAGWSPLHFAAQSGSIETVQLMFDRVQSPYPLTIAGVTPLGIACANNSPDVGMPNP